MADDTKMLNDILQGLVTTDQKVIEKINTDVAELEDKVSRGSGSYGLADINSPSSSSDGELIDDIGASHGKAYSITTSSGQSYCLYSGEFSDVKFGKYAACIRVKASAAVTNNIIQVTVYNGNTGIKTIDYSGADFENSMLENNINYSYLYFTFDYDGDGVTKNNLKIEVYTHQIDNIVVNFDYAYISMIIPAVFL